VANQIVQESYPFEGLSFLAKNIVNLSVYSQSPDVNRKQKRKDVDWTPSKIGKKKSMIILTETPILSLFKGVRDGTT